MFTKNPPPATAPEPEPEPIDLSHVSVGDLAYPPLTGADRCDRCIAAAQVRVVRDLDGRLHDLVFCRHHLNAYEFPLTEQGFTVHGGVSTP